jgi:cation diffusion facilitator family transporter
VSKPAAAPLLASAEATAAEVALYPPASAPTFTARERHQARRLLAVLGIVSLFFCAQLAGAIWAESAVLRVEALHVLTDVAALGLAYLAMRIAIRRPTARFTFGLRRVEPVAAIFNALLVIGATVVLVVGAASELASGAGPRADRMLYVAAMGLVVNGVAAWLIHGAIGAHAEHDHAGHNHENPASEPACDDHSHRHIAGHAHDGRRHGPGHALNLRGAWLHLLGDALGSLAALVAAVAIELGVSPKADPVASFLVAAVLLYGGVRLLKDAVLILLEASPGHLRVGQVRESILRTQGVAHLHDLHVWTLGAGHDAITAHVSASEPDPELAARVERALRERFQVEYVTIQVELGGVTCQTFPP